MASSKVKSGIGFRIDYTYNSRFISNTLEKQLSKEALLYLKKQGVDAYLLGQPMRGAGFDISLLLKIVGYFLTALKYLGGTFGRIANKNLENSSPKFNLYMHYIVEDNLIDSFSKKPGEVMTEVLDIAAMIQAWMKENYGHYGLFIEANLYYKYFDYQLICRVSKGKLFPNDIGILINFIKGCKIKSFITESVSLTPKLFIEHSKGVFNIDNRQILHKKYRYFKFDKIYNGLTSTRGIKKVKLLKGSINYEVKPRVRGTNI